MIAANTFAAEAGFDHLGLLSAVFEMKDSQRVFMEFYLILCCGGWLMIAPKAPTCLIASAKWWKWTGLITEAFTPSL